MEYQDLKSGIKNHLNDAAEDFFMVGYFLRQISENALFAEDGYKSIWDFAKREYGLSTSSTSRFMAINARISGFRKRFARKAPYLPRPDAATGNMIVSFAPTPAAYGRRSGAVGRQPAGTLSLAHRWAKKRGLVWKPGFSTGSASIYIRGWRRYGKGVKSRIPAASIVGIKYVSPVATSQRNGMRRNVGSSCRNGRRKPRIRSRA